MHKKRGFTLVEVLVVIAVATLVLAMVGGTLVFMATSSGKLIHKAEEITQTQAIEKYLRGILVEKVGETVYQPKITSVSSDQITVKYTDESEDKSIILNLENNGTLSITTINGSEDEFVFENTGLSYAEFSVVNGFVHCILTYKDSSTYDFIIGIT